MRFILLFFLGAAAGQFTADSLKNERMAVTSLSAAKKHFSASQTAKGFEELLRAEDLYKKTGNKNGLRSVMMAFAGFYETKLLWAAAAAYYKRAFLLSNLNDSTLASADIAFRAANALYKQAKYKEAERFNDYSLNQFKSKNDKGKAAESCVLMANIKREQKKYAAAEDLILHQALPLFRSADNVFGRISCFDALGHIYHEQKRYSEAKWFFIQANMQSRSLRDTTGIITSLINLGRVKTDIKDYYLAIPDFKEADSLSRRKNMIFLRAEAQKAFADLYRKSGNEKLYERYMSQYRELNRQWADTLKNRNTVAIQAKSAAEISLIQPAQAVKPPLKKNAWLYFLSALIVLFIVSAILIFFRRKKQ